MPVFMRENEDSSDKNIYSSDSVQKNNCVSKFIR